MSVENPNQSEALDIIEEREALLGHPEWVARADEVTPVREWPFKKLVVPGIPLEAVIQITRDTATNAFMRGRESMYGWVALAGLLAFLAGLVLPR